MSTRKSQETQGNNTEYEDLLRYYHLKRKQYPKGVSPKLQNKKTLLLQFKDPITGNRTSKGCNEVLSYSGIDNALKKAEMIVTELKRAKTVSEFLSWYDRVILEKSAIENNMRTYEEIFDILKSEYFNGFNKNTKRRRDINSPSDIHSFNSYYMQVFSKIENVKEYPKLEDFQDILFSWEKGTKSFKDAYHVLLKIASLSHLKDEIYKLFESIDYKQTVFRENQSISWEQFYNWFSSELEKIEKGTEHDPSYRQSYYWLWVSAMCVVYGLRPTEVLAVKNIFETVIIDGIEIPALINDSKDNLIYLGDFTKSGLSTKTGKRICKPLINDKDLIYQLRIKKPLLCEFINDSENASYTVNEFNNKFRKGIMKLNCPISQPYAFRHLANQMGEKYGISQEIRARCLGHSVNVNESIYKKRQNTQTTIDILTNHSIQPLPLETAKQALEHKGIIIDGLIIEVLRIIYQTNEV